MTAIDIENAVRKYNRKMNNTSVAEREKTAKFSTDEGIKVKVFYPIEVGDTKWVVSKVTLYR